MFSSQFFSCGHLYHSSCLGISGTTLGATCLLCDKSTKPSATHLPRAMTSSWVINIIKLINHNNYNYRILLKVMEDKKWYVSIN